MSQIGFSNDQSISSSAIGISMNLTNNHPTKIPGNIDLETDIASLNRSFIFEFIYQSLYDDVREAIKSQHFESSLDHFCRYGISEGRLSPDQAVAFLSGFDVSWYKSYYHCNGTDIQALNEYLTKAKHECHSPSPFFDESSFLSDNSIIADKFQFGYLIYIQRRAHDSFKIKSVAEGEESRRRLAAYNLITKIESLMPSVTQPVAIQRYHDLRHKLEKRRIVAAKTSEKCLNVIIPNLAPEIFFGGYGALFQFCKWLQFKNIRLRFIVTDQPQRSNPLEVRLSFFDNELVNGVLSKSEITFLTGDRLSVSAGDDALCYSLWSSDLGKEITQATGGVLFFFIQEYEPSFYPAGSMAFLCASGLNTFHIPIFNSQELCNYFQSHKLGVFSDRLSRNGTLEHFTFSHCIPKFSLPTHTELRNRTNRRLVFYARPEGHAERNIFEIGVMALSQAIEQGIFDDNWEFIGVGSLGSIYDIQLPNGHVLRCGPKESSSNYYQYLAGFDVGMSFIYAPHPGVVHLEMAAAGLPVVTNCFENRDATHLEQISKNLIGSECTVDGIVASLSKAQKIAMNPKQRISGAKVNMPKTWGESFERISQIVKHLTPN